MVVTKGVKIAIGLIVIAVALVGVYLLLHDSRCGKCPKGGKCSIFTRCECPGKCSGHGKCDRTNGVCGCDAGYGGDDCSQRLCPKNCSGRGKCDYKTGVCKCDKDWDSEDCSIDKSDWHTYMEMVKGYLRKLGHQSCPKVVNENGKFNAQALWDLGNKIAALPDRSVATIQKAVDDYCGVKSSGFVMAGI